MEETAGFGGITVDTAAGRRRKKRLYLAIARKAGAVCSVVVIESESRIDGREQANGNH
jgi:hypothetical protein